MDTLAELTSYSLCSRRGASERSTHDDQKWLRDTIVTGSHDSLGKMFFVPLWGIVRAH